MFFHLNLLYDCNKGVTNYMSFFINIFFAPNPSRKSHGYGGKNLKLSHIA